MAMLQTPLPRFKPGSSPNPVAQAMVDPAQPQQPPAAFVWGDNGQQLSPEDVARKRQIAQAMMQEGSSYAPVQHWTQGLARVAEALAGGLEERRARDAEAGGKQSAQDALTAWTNEQNDPSIDPKTRMAHAMALADNPWLGEGARGVLMQSLKKEDAQPFAGTGFDASAANILTAGQKDPGLRASPQYALAWANQTQPRVIQDAAGRSVLYTPPPPQGILPPIYPGQGAPQGAAPSPAGAPRAAQPMPQPAAASGAVPAPMAAPGSTGSISPIEGSGAPKPNEQQLKNAGFYVRQSAAEKTLENPDMLAKYLDPSNAIPRDMLHASFLQSGDAQAIEQAGDEWINGVLRPDSGAVIGPAEMSQYRKTYIPQWGDKPELIAQKLAARTRVADSIKSGLTPEQAVAADGIIMKTPNPVSAPKSAGPQAGTIEDGMRFKGGNPGDPANWEPADAGGQGGPMLNTVPPDADPYQLQDLMNQTQATTQRHRKMLAK